MKNFDQIKEQKHFAQTLIQGDRIKATIRHDTDGSKNIIKADMIFLKCNLIKKTIDAVYDDYVIEIPFNEIEQETY